MSFGDVLDILCVDIAGGIYPRVTHRRGESFPNRPLGLHQGQVTCEIWRGVYFVLGRSIGFLRAETLVNTLAVFMSF